MSIQSTQPRAWLRAAAAAAVLGLASLAGACSFNYSSGDEPKIELKPGTPEQQHAAGAAAREILQAFDAGHPEAAWSHASSYLQSTSSESSLTTTVRTLRSAVGQFKQRKVLGGGFAAKVDANSPPGDYCAIFFESTFESTTVQEKVILVFESGQWRLAGYFLEKKYTFGKK